MKFESPGFSPADALLYLCASRCSLGRLSRTLVGVTAGTGLITAIVHVLAG